MAQASFNPKTVNLWTSRIIPLILIGIVGYVTYVVIVLICVDYLLKPPTSLQSPRHGAAAAILVLYSILLLLIALTYFRLLYTVTYNPGYVPRGPQWHAQRERKAREKRQYGRDYRKTQSPVSSEGIEGDVITSSEDAFAPTTTEPAPGLRDFYNKDAFVCQGDGRPIWCSTCLNWKPDRTHHCREIQRCVRKMDHYCPWVGGVVSETSFKFFTQFVAWTAIYCIFNLIVAAYFLAEYRRKNERHVGNNAATTWDRCLMFLVLSTRTLNVQWLVVLCLGALFGLFTAGMTGTSLQFAIVNTTTIENLSRKTIVWTIALYMPRLPEATPGFRTISYSAGQTSEGSNAHTDHPSREVRTFAILYTKPGENPFDLGPYRNFVSVFGDHWYDWLLPIRYSPCCNHDRQEGEFAMGPVVKRMRREAGIEFPEEADEKSHRRRRHRRRRRSSHNTGVKGIRTSQGQNIREKDGPGTGNDRDEVELEEGLGRTNGTAYHS